VKCVTKVEHMIVTQPKTLTDAAVVCGEHVRCNDGLVDHDPQQSAYSVGTPTQVVCTRNSMNSCLLN